MTIASKVRLSPLDLKEETLVEVKKSTTFVISSYLKPNAQHYDIDIARITPSKSP